MTAERTPPLFRLIRLKTVQIAFVILVFILGIGIRLYDLDDPPMDFHPARQYHSAVIARGLYTQWGGEYPEWQAKIHIAQNLSEARIEPPIFEHLTALTFLAAQTDALWIPRLYAILFWVLGGIPLYLLARRIQGYETGLVALGFYLLLPFGVYASRSFQPDPLMVACILFALWALDRWQERPSLERALGAGAWMGVAVLVKQVALFPLLAAFLVLLLVKWGWRRAANRQAWLITVLAVMPALLYNLYGIFISGTLAGQYSQRFFPALWIDPGFYIRWSNMIQAAVGLPLFLFSLLGLFLIRDKAQRGLAFGFLIGYLAYGFVFAHHISTHDYYQLPVLPLVALGLGLAASRLFNEARQSSGKWLGSVGVSLVLLAAVLLGLWEARATLKAENYREEPALLAGLFESMGGHRTPTAGLMEDYGAAVYYYAYNLPAYWWPQENGISLNKMNREEIEGTIRNRLSDREFFIVTDFKALQAQPEVEAYLNLHYDIFFENERYRVYDLQNKPEH